ncbi:M15 family metallopeptidase [Bradyrhizobium prioriisuperbiae]|uniref:M15 family metallopeptidase n=1 Tax=Bradyrhizobium prioriisuperbiae TaxID=2854389 RepID=UPI0028E694AA|nr:M15 family metallopeptidase [Bradyrhizobium prioritasuperba]
MPDVKSLIAAGLGCLLALVLGSAAAAQGLPDDFVFLRDVDPSIRQDIRYAGLNNFVGRRLPGYDAAECVVKRAVARALAQVQRDLAPRRLSLKMYDCYRPARAVHDMVVWSKDGRETPAQHTYNPGMRKADLFRLGYIAEHSGHSTGAAVDLTLVEVPAPKVEAFDPGRLYGDCTAGVRQRAPDDAVDMGTGYDCSDTKAHTAAAGITPAQRQRRQTLVAAMTKVGFVNYAKEWWHFSLPGIGGAAYDFPIAR